MNFTATRGSAFVEEFNFRDAEGRSVYVPAAGAVLTLERGEVAKEYAGGTGLSIQPTKIIWTLTAEETAGLEYSTMYYSLRLPDQELTRGVLRIIG